MQTETATTTPAPADFDRDQILTVLRTFINSRPGLNFANYGDVSAYRSEQRAITKDRDHALTLLQYVTWNRSIDADALRAAFRDAYSGRLSLGWRAFGALKWQRCADLPADHDYSGGQFALDYCTGQYYPTEYRRAACAVLASAIWDYWRDGCMPSKHSAPNWDGDKVYSEALRRFVSPGDWLRAKARAEFGRTIARRWFN